MNSKLVQEYIVGWLKEYAQNAKTKGLVVGVSGGIDSAVVAHLCARTGLETLCVEMPIHQNLNQVNRGKELIKGLLTEFPNVKTTVTDLTPVFEVFRQSLPESTDLDRLQLTLANTRSRLRMIALYYHAGIHSSLVVGTGNKIEDFGVGFYTKYGDGGVDVSPIADLMKSEVYALGRFMGVPDVILQAKPTDGLFGDDRSDEDQLGANYDELEWAMLAHQKNKRSSDFTGRERDVFEIYTRLNTLNQHKMNPIPVCKIPEELR